MFNIYYIFLPPPHIRCVWLFGSLSPQGAAKHNLHFQITQKSFLILYQFLSTKTFTRIRPKWGCDTPLIHKPKKH